MSDQGTTSDSSLARYARQMRYPPIGIEGHNKLFASFVVGGGAGWKRRRL